MEIGALGGLRRRLFDGGRQGNGAKDRWFAVTASGETLSKTTIGSWKAGDPVNLERPMRVGDEFGGHIVSGHIDGVAEVKLMVPEGESTRVAFEVPVALSKFIASKGSVALDGVSLTVNEAEGARFGVNIIPHTSKVTTFGRLKPGAKVNLEIDLWRGTWRGLSENERLCLPRLHFED